MSISPVMMISVIGRASSAIGAMPSSAIVMFDTGEEILGDLRTDDEGQDEHEEKEDLPAREDTCRSVVISRLSASR